MKIKEILSFSDEEIKKILDNRIKDELILIKNSNELTDEDNFIIKLFSKDKDIRFLLSSMYLNNTSINKVLSDYYSNMSAGQDFKSVNSNNLSVLKFTHKLHNDSNSKIKSKDERIYHFRKQIENIIDLIKKRDPDYNIECLNDFLSENISKLDFSVIYKILENNWENIKDHTYTYRLLCDMILLSSEYNNYHNTRLELIKVLNSTL